MTKSKPAEKSKTEVAKVKKPEIKKGIKAATLQNELWIDDLREFCLKHGIVRSGKKTVLIKRIIDFLDHDKKTGPKAPKRPKKSEAAKKKEAKAKAKAKKEKEAAKSPAKEKESAKESKKADAPAADAPATPEADAPKARRKSATKQA